MDGVIGAYNENVMQSALSEFGLELFFNFYRE